MKKIFKILGTFIILILISVSFWCFSNIKDRHSGYTVDLKIFNNIPSELKAGFATMPITPEVLDRWADKNGDLGRVYGAQWTDWRTPDSKSINQIKNLVDGLKKDPFGRRHIVSAWNPGELDKMALPPCHALFQFHVSSKKELSCQLYQRSADLFLGVPFNIASYALLTMMVAQVCGYKPKEFVHTFGDLHIYKNHIEQVHTQLERTPRALPQMKINPLKKNLEDFVYEDFTLEGYDPYPTIKAPIAI